MESSDILLILVAIIFPPAAAFMISGCGCDFWLNILLTILGYIPGHIHAFYIIYVKMRADETFGPNSRHGYEYVDQGPQHSHQTHGYTASPQEAPASQHQQPFSHPAPETAPGVSNGKQAPNGPPPSYGSTMNSKPAQP